MSDGHKALCTCMISSRSIKLSLGSYGYTPTTCACEHIIIGESLFGGMERWNGIVEWNSGTTTPIKRLL